MIAGGTEMMCLRQRLRRRRCASRRDVGGGGMGTGNAAAAGQKHPQTNQGVAADAIAAMEGISREELEAFGVESQRRAARRDRGRPLRQVDYRR